MVRQPPGWPHAKFWKGCYTSVCSATQDVISSGSSPLQHLSVRLHDMPNPRIKAVSEPTPCCAAMSFLIPIGVVVYAAIGGLKSTFSTAYFHTVIVFVLALIFMFKVYVPGDLLGGIDDVSP